MGNSASQKPTWVFCYSVQGAGPDVGGPGGQEWPVLCAGAGQHPPADAHRVQDTQPRLEQNLHFVSTRHSTQTGTKSSLCKYKTLDPDWNKIFTL